MTTKYWQARAYWAEAREIELKKVLKDLIGALDAARAALAKDDDPEPRFELEE